jgi:AcrR family transcriptional regulator
VPSTPTTRRRRGPYAKTAARREAILDAALDVFGQQGYHAGSLREVAARVELSEAGVLHHFASKAELLTAVLDRRDAVVEDAVTPASASGEERLSRMLQIARQNALRPGMIELFLRLAAEATAEDHPAHEFFVRRLVFTRTQFRNAFTDLAERGLLAPGVEVQSAIITSIAVWNGLQLQWLMDRSIDVPGELAGHLQRLTTVPLK